MTVERMSVPLITNFSARDRGLTPNGKDGYLHNAYVDKSANGQVYAKKRPGLSYYAHGAKTNPYGIYFWNYNSVVVSVWGTDLWAGAVNSGTLTSNAGKVSFLDYSYNGTNDLYILTNGPSSGQLWRLAAVGYVLSNVAGFIATRMVPGLIYIDGYALSCSNYGRLYNSNLGDPSTWTSTNYVTASQSPDWATALTSHHNHAVVMGRSSIEFFYNAGLPTGSPFSRRSDIFINTGCHQAGSIAKVGDKVFFVAQDFNGAPYVAVLDNFRVQKISTPDIDRKLFQYYIAPSSDYCNGALLDIDGKTFYVLSVTTMSGDAAAGAVETFIYDVELNFWSVWNGAQDAYLKIIDASQGTKVPLGSSPGTFSKQNFVQADLTYTGIYSFFSNQYYDDISGSTANFTVEIVTPKVTGIGGQGHRRKFLSELNLMGKRTTGTVDISYSDDDYATWISAGSVQVNPEKKLSGLGSFYERAFKIVATTNEDLKISDMELAIEYGRR